VDGSAPPRHSGRGPSEATEGELEALVAASERNTRVRILSVESITVRTCHGLDELRHAWSLQKEVLEL